jgi:hypothetical protein
MFAILSVRFAGAFAGVMGMLSLALFTAALVSIPSFPTTGAGLLSSGPTTVVNRALKGDRLSILGPTARQHEFGSSSPASPLGAQQPAKIPPGCDPAFSPISSPRLARVFKRCIA